MGRGDLGVDFRTALGHAEVVLVTGKESVIIQSKFYSLIEKHCPRHFNEKRIQINFKGQY